MHDPPGVNVTIPEGVMAVPDDVSITVAVHVEACPITTVDGEQTTDVVVDRRPTATLAVPLLVE